MVFLGNQDLVKFSKRASYSALHRAFREAEDRRRGAVGMAFEIGELQDPAFALAQRNQCFTHGFGLGDGKECRIDFGLRRGGLFGHAAFTLLASLPGPNDVDGPAVRLGQQERPQTSSGLVETAGLLPKTDEHVLHDILGERFVIKDASRKPGDRRSVPTKRLAERELISSSNCGDQLIVGRVGVEHGRRVSRNHGRGCSSPKHVWITSFRIVSVYERVNRRRARIVRSVRLCPMACFVLVHGSFRGGWYFGPVAEILRRQGHGVWTPSLAGMGEHAHHAPLLAAAGPLPRSVWVNDLVSLVVSHDLHDVVLVGHSLGGLIAAEAADHLGPERIAVLGFLDAPVLRPGQSPADLFSAPSLGADTPHQPMPDPAMWVSPLPVNRHEITDDGLAQWMAERLCANPVGPGIGPLVIEDVTRWERIAHQIAFCTRTPSAFPPARSRVLLDAAGTVYDTIEAGHDAPVSAPALVAAWLGSLVPVAPARQGSMER